MSESIEVSFEVAVPELDVGEIRRVLAAVLEREGADLGLSVALVDDAAIHRLNREFLDHDHPTDVISFDLGDDPGVGGEIVVSVDTARREAAERGCDLRSELLLYCVHGVLHLLGYDDHDVEDRSRMHARQRELLAELGYETTE